MGIFKQKTRGRYRWVIPMVVGCILAVFLTVLFRPPLGQEAPAVERSIRYTFFLKNSENRAISSARVAVFLPRHTGAYQTVTHLTGSLPGTVQISPLGNASYTVALLVPPFGTQSLLIESQLTLKGTPPAETLRDRERYLRPEQWIESRDPAIESLAVSLSKTAATSTEFAAAANRWVDEKMQQANYSPTHLGARHALQQRSGDCTEQAFLLTALLRNREIPARVVSGFIVSNNAVLRAGEYHNWVEFYDAGAWRISDPFYMVHDTGYDRYVVFQNLGEEPSSDVGLPPGARFFSDQAALELRME